MAVLFMNNMDDMYTKWRPWLHTFSSLTQDQSRTLPSIGSARRGSRICFGESVGVGLFGKGIWESDEGRSGEFVAISLTCLDGVGDEVLAGLEVVFRNRKEGKFEERPAVVGHL
jgi:hypothetical protein